MADAIALLYKEFTPPNERTAPRIWLTMTKAQQKMVKLIQAKNFDKHVIVANPKNSDVFFDEVPLLCFLFITSTMLYFPFS